MDRLSEEPPRLREYVSMLEILASNRELNLNIEEELEMLSIDYEKMPTYRIGMKKGVQQGLEQGAHHQALKIAANLLAEGMSLSKIALLTQLPLAEVETLSREKDKPLSPNNS